MKKNLLRALVALMAILLLVTSCALAEAPRDTLVWAMSAEPASLDPMNTASMNTFTITYALYDCLTALPPCRICLLHTSCLYPALGPYAEKLLSTFRDAAQDSSAVILDETEL